MEDKNKQKGLIIAVVLVAAVIGIFAVVQHNNNVRHAEYEKEVQEQAERSKRMAENEAIINDAEDKIKAANEAKKMLEEIERNSSK